MFFFSSRRRHTRLDSDWSSDVCSSDLEQSAVSGLQLQTVQASAKAPGIWLLDDHAAPYGDFDDIAIVGLVDADWPERPRRNIRSEERRVGKERRSRRAVWRCKEQRAKG